MNIISINVGKPETVDYKGKEIRTGIYKNEVMGPIHLGKVNFDGDEQADLVNHGGVDKAVCVYPFEHYAYWEKDLDRPLTHGAFGENLTVAGMLESEVCIGDIFQIGETIVQVSQPSQPCFKLAKRYDLKDLPLKFQNTGYTGYYFRVLQEGLMSQSSAVQLLEKSPQHITIERANFIMHHDRNNSEAIEEILSIDELSTSWRNTFQKRLRGNLESTKSRLEGNSQNP